MNGLLRICYSWNARETTLWSRGEIATNRERLGRPCSYQYYSDVVLLQVAIASDCGTAGTHIPQKN